MEISFFAGLHADLEKMESRPNLETFRKFNGQWPDDIFVVVVEGTKIKYVDRASSPSRGSPTPTKKKV